MSNDELTPETSERGFKRFPAIPSEYGGEISVYESSAASGPHVWLNAECPVDLLEPDGPKLIASMHLTAENARRLGQQLIHLADNHYQEVQQ